ncbi:MAG: flagellar protein [Lachnospiraceae bacterium]|nr:flagellar protein [Lachnospiraceae bacterium]
MNVKNCKKCGKMFNYIAGPPICPACREAIEAKFQGVKEYVREHRAATMQQIVRDCDVEQRQVEQWVREERLVFSDESPIKLFCETCGAPIITGRYCDKCKKGQADTFSAAGQRPEASKPAPGRHDSGAKMYTFKK